MRWVLLLFTAAAAATSAIDDAPKLRTRFTFRRPTGDNVFSILFGCDDLHQLPEKIERIEKEVDSKVPEDNWQQLCLHSRSDFRSKFNDLGDTVYAIGG